MEIVHRTGKAAWQTLSGALGVLALLASGMAYAAPPGSALPGSGDPGRILEDLKQLPEPAVAAPSVTVSPVEAAPPPAGAASAVFRLDQVEIEGATAYSQDSLQAVFRPYLGQYMSLRKLYELTALITQRYHDDGYALSKAVIPPQAITDGTVRIQVVEGYISDIKTEGHFRDSPVAQGIIDRIKSYRPLNARDLERDMLLLNDLGGVAVRAVLKPTDSTGEQKSAPGSAGLALVFEDVPVPASVSVDNLGSRYTGPYQVGLSAGVNSLVIPYSQTLFSGLESIPANNLKVVSLSQRMPLNSYGTAATLQASYAHSEPGYRLTPEDVVSDSYNYGIALSHPLIRSRAQNLYLGGDLTVKDIATDTLGYRLYDDRLRIASASATYDLQDRWGGSNLGLLRLSQGLDLLGESRTGSPDLSRAGGHSDFTKGSGNIGRLQGITETVHLYMAAEGQYAWSPLLSSEQFGFGGQQFGRAYDPSELTGDDGVAGMIELRYTLPAGLPKLSSELFTFYDIGRVWNYGDAGNAESAASAGLGVRFTWNEHLSGNLTLAKPLTRKAEAPDYGSGKDTRAFFSLTASY